MKSQMQQKNQFETEIEVLELERPVFKEKRQLDLVIPIQSKSQIAVKTKSDDKNEPEIFKLLDAELPTPTKLLEPIKQPLARQLKRYKTPITWGIRIYWGVTGFGLFYFLSAILYFSGSTFSHLNNL